MNGRAVATRETAALSGMALGFGLVAYDFIFGLFPLAPATKQWTTAILLILLFVVPVMLFVVGVRHFRFGWRDWGNGAHWPDLREVVFRGLFWLIGGGFAFAVASILTWPIK